jgi:polysaccharide biosynthesis/export protein
MRTATLILLFAVPIFAAPQDRAKSKSEGSQTSTMPAGPPPRFEAIPANVTAGQATQLTWTVEGATSVNIQPVVGNVPASGSAPVTPGETTTYTLTAVVPSGNVTATTTVTVALAGPGATPPSVELPAPAATTPAGMTAPVPSAATSAMPEMPKAGGTAPGIDPTKMGAPRDGTNKPPAKVDEHAFILGAEDQIAISVYGSPEFSGSHMIRPDGKITLNFIGEVTATDLTPEQLSNEIKERIKKYIVDPDVSVQVLAVRSKKYFIQGEVGRTGEFPLTVPTRVLEALVNAGGFKDFANKKNIIIMRGTDMRGTQRIRFNYNEVIKGKHLEQNIYLQPGDIILVR